MIRSKVVRRQMNQVGWILTVKNKKPERVLALLMILLYPMVIWVIEYWESLTMILNFILNIVGTLFIGRQLIIKYHFIMIITSIPPITFVFVLHVINYFAMRKIFWNKRRSFIRNFLKNRRRRRRVVFLYCL